MLFEQFSNILIESLNAKIQHKILAIYLLFVTDFLSLIKRIQKVYKSGKLSTPIL